MAYQPPKTAAAPPAVTDDSTKGFVVGSLWFDTVSRITYACYSAAIGAAVWVAMGAVAGLLTQPQSVLNEVDLENYANLETVAENSAQAPIDVLNEVDLEYFVDLETVAQNSAQQPAGVETPVWSA